MVEVVYRGEGMDGVTSNAASEATLLKLLEAFGKGGGDSGALDKLAQASKRRDTKDIKDHSKRTKEDSEATAEHSLLTRGAIKGLKALTSAITMTTSALFSGIGNVVETIANLGLELLSGGTRLSDFSSHLTGLIDKIPLIGGLLSTPLQMLSLIHI